MAKLLDMAMEKEVNFFDHTDIYGVGECEKIFAKALQMVGIKAQSQLRAYNIKKCDL